MAKVRIGHFVEAQICRLIEIDYIDESEVLTPADDLIHVDKTKLMCFRLWSQGPCEALLPYL